MLNTKLAAFIGSAILSGAVFASEPLCPSLSAIQAEGLAQVTEVMGLYGSYKISNYGTDVLWGFMIAPLNTESEDEAFDLATDILNNMNAPGVYQMENGFSICTYNSGVSGVYALAGEVTAYPLPIPEMKQWIQKFH